MRVTICTNIDWPKSYYQPLFDHMLDEHGLTLLEGEMDEICYAVDRMKGGDKRMAARKELTRADVIKRLMEVVEKSAEDIDCIAWCAGYAAGKTVGGGGKVAVAKKVSKAAPKKPKGKIGKAVKRK